MDAQKRNEIIKIVVNAIVAVVTALFAASCTVIACGRVPFQGL